jgi:hypothetical protein
VRDVVAGLVLGGFTRPSVETIIRCCVLPIVRQLERSPSRFLMSTFELIVEHSAMVCVCACCVELHRGACFWKRLVAVCACVRVFVQACVNALLLPLLTCEGPRAAVTPPCLQVSRSSAWWCSCIALPTVLLQVVMFVLPKLSTELRSQLLCSVLSLPAVCVSEHTVSEACVLWSDATFPVFQALVCAQPGIVLSEVRA